MNSSISKRRAFLASRKNAGNRVTVGFTGIADFRSYIGQEYIAGMMKAASDYDINFINFAGAIKYSLFDDINFISHYLKNFKFMRSPLVDGLVTWSSSLREFLEADEVTDNFNMLKPLPMVDIGYFDISGIPSIRIDNSYSISILMEHLINVHKYTRFAFIGSTISSPHQSRLNCYREELAKHSIFEIPNSVFMAKTMDSSQLSVVVDEFISRFIKNGHCEIECIVTSSDIIASAVIEELDKHGISVPKDIAVTGFNNQYSGISARSPVTTLDLEYFKRGYSAVELLIDRIMDPEEEIGTVLVPTSLLVRQSCGCFEQSVVAAGECEFHDTLENEIADSSEELLREFFTKKFKDIFTQISEREINSLLNAMFSDIYENLNPSRMLRWFQTLLQNVRKESTLGNRDLQQYITRLRKLILPLVKDNENQFARMENIFHQLRTLISVYNEYDKVSPHENIYTMNNLSQIAINFATATTGAEIKEVLCHQLSEMGITGIILALSENMTSEPGAANIELVQPELPFILQDKLPYKVSDPIFFPKQFFHQTRRFSVILETLHHEDKYFGYAFLEVGNPNIAIYDSLRLLLSNALNQVYFREGRTKEKSLMLKNEELVGILNLPKKNNPEENKGGLSASQITNYLIEHINEMTNLDLMAEELSVSKSHLVRRAKELTGYTIQNLHEKLKIEQAKNLLQVDSIKLTEISNRLGFQNQNYFSSVFKKNTGMSPREWAKRHSH